MAELKNNVPNLFTDGGFLGFLQEELKSKDEKRRSRANDIFDNLASYFTKIPGYMDAANEYMKQQAKGLFESSEAVRRSQRTDNPGDRFDSLRVMPLNTRISRAQTVGEREELLKSKQIKDRETAERLFRMGSMNGFNASAGVKRELAALRKENGVRSFGNIEAFRGRKDGDRELVMNDAYRNARTIEFGDDGSRTTTVGVRRAEELLRQKQKEEEGRRFDMQNQADMFGGVSSDRATIGDALWTAAMLKYGNERSRDLMDRSERALNRNWERERGVYEKMMRMSPLFDYGSKYTAAPADGVDTRSLPQEPKPSVRDYDPGFNIGPKVPPRDYDPGFNIGSKFPPRGYDTGAGGGRQLLARGWLDSLFTTTAAFKGGRSSRRRS